MRSVPMRSSLASPKRSLRGCRTCTTTGVSRTASSRSPVSSRKAAASACRGRWASRVRRGHGSSMRSLRLGAEMDRDYHLRHEDRDPRSAGELSRARSMLRKLGAEALEVRKPEQLDGLDGLVVPGGESTTFMRLMRLYGLEEAIRAFERPI